MNDQTRASRPAEGLLRPHVTLAAVASTIGVGERALRKRARRGTFPAPIYLSPGHWIIWRDEWDAWLAVQAQGFRPQQSPRREEHRAQRA